MATYFESINDALTVQITDQFTNYALWKKGRVTAVNGPAGVTKVFAANFALPSSGSVPIIVFDTQPGTGVMVLSQAIRNGRCYFTSYSTDVNAFSTMDYYVYITANDPEIVIEARGLFTLWDESGRVVYDSDANYLKVLDQIEQVYSSPSTVRTYNVSKVGVVSSRSMWFVNPAGSPGGWIQLAGCAVVTGVNGLGNKIEAGYFPLRYISNQSNQFPDPSDSGNARRPTSMVALICDISKLDSVPYDFIT